MRWEAGAGARPWNLQRLSKAKASKTLSLKAQERGGGSLEMVEENSGAGGEQSHARGERNQWEPCVF